MPPTLLESAAMRRWPVILFLLLVLPFQMVWAAAAPICAHEMQVGGNKHFGHHEHRHQGTEQTAPAADDNGNGSGAYHADCQTCHLGSSATLASTVVAVVALPHGAVRGDHGARYRSHVPSGPERPDRIELTAAARFCGGVEFRPLPA